MALQVLLSLVRGERSGSDNLNLHSFRDGSFLCRSDIDPLKLQFAVDDYGLRLAFFVLRQAEGNLSGVGLECDYRSADRHPWCRFGCRLFGRARLQKLEHRRLNLRYRRWIRPSVGGVPLGSLVGSYLDIDDFADGAIHDGSQIGRSPDSQAAR